MKKTIRLIGFLFSLLGVHADVQKKVYEFKPGTYRILDFPVNIRSAFGLSAQVIGRLDLNDEIEILENMNSTQTIDGKTHYWYKIRHNDQIGYVWGGLIAVKSFNFSVDGYDVKAYYRYSYVEGRITGPEKVYSFYYPMIQPDDLFIYINNRRIDNREIKRVYETKYFTLRNSYRYYVRNDWHYAWFSPKDNTIQFSLTDSAAADSLFTISTSGEIRYIDTTIGWL